VSLRAHAHGFGGRRARPPRRHEEGAGIIVYARRIEELVRPHAEVDEFQIVFRRHEGLDDILVRVDPSPSLSLSERDGLRAQLGESLRTGLGLRVSVEITEPGALPRWDHKARRVKDERTEVPF